jgi:hypothetical protein
MDNLWKQLPIDIICKILEYNTSITYRNGVFINKIINPDKNYSILLERMRFKRYRRFLRTLSFVTIHIPNVDKQYYYLACKNGLRVISQSGGYFDDNEYKEEILYTNI